MSKNTNKENNIKKYCYARLYKKIFTVFRMIDLKYIILKLEFKK